jgi:hypothetical protein
VCILKLTPDEIEWPVTGPSRFISGEDYRRPTFWIGGWVYVGLETEERERGFVCR